MKKSVAIYTRVSSDEQVKGYSLDTQEEQLKKYCGDNKLSLDEVYREEGVSGAKKHRPQLDRLMKDARKKKFNLVLVYKIDRFSRSLKNLLDLLAELEKHKIGFKSITEVFDTSNAMGKYMLQNMGGIAELEREMIRERTVSGQRKYREKGFWWGNAPYGYDVKDRKLVINKKEAYWVKKMYDWLVSGRVSCHEIQRRLNNLKVTTKYDNLGIKKPKNHNGWWHKRTVNKIIRDKMYAGTFVYRKDKTKVKVPAIISQDLYDKAQQQIARNIRYATRKAKHIYLFNGMIECGKCGGRWGCSCSDIKTRHKDKLYVYKDKRYLCYKTMKWVSKDICPSKSIAETKIDYTVWSEVYNLFTDPKLAFSKLEKIRDKEVSNDELKKKQEELIKLIDKTKEQKRRLVDLYLNKAIDEDIYLDKLRDVENHLAQLTEEKEKYDSQILTEEEKKLRIKSVEEMFKQFKYKLTNINYQQKRELYKRLIDKIIIVDKDIDIQLTLPYPAELMEDSQRNPCLSKKRNWHQPKEH